MQKTAYSSKEYGKSETRQVVQEWLDSLIGNLPLAIENRSEPDQTPLSEETPVGCPTCRVALFLNTGEQTCMHSLQERGFWQQRDLVCDNKGECFQITRVCLPSWLYPNPTRTIEEDSVEADLVPAMLKLVNAMTNEDMSNTVNTQQNETQEEPGVNEDHRIGDEIECLRGEVIDSRSDTFHSDVVVDALDRIESMEDLNDLSYSSYATHIRDGVSGNAVMCSTRIEEITPIHSLKKKSGKEDNSEALDIQTNEELHHDGGDGMESNIRCSDIEKDTDEESQGSIQVLSEFPSSAFPFEVWMSILDLISLRDVLNLTHVDDSASKLVQLWAHWKYNKHGDY